MNLEGNEFKRVRRDKFFAQTEIDHKKRLPQCYVQYKKLCDSETDSIDTDQEIPDENVHFQIKV